MATNEILSIAEEVINAEGLEPLLQSTKEVIGYDGFEPSGKMHICQGLYRVDNIKKMTKHGIKFKIWLADWFAQLNHKFDGDLKKIRNAGLLMIEIWKACGLESENVEFIWASEEINKRSAEYWQLMMDIAAKTTLARTLRCTPAMGRKNITEDPNYNDEPNQEQPAPKPLAASHIFYPIMQCADIFFLGVDICSLGLDQKKVNALAIEYCDKIKRKYKPVILSHHMLMGLNGSTKMAKSDPDNAIFMDDSPSEVKRKVKKAYCEPAEVDNNPILEYMKYLIFPAFETVLLERKEAHGGNLSLNNYQELAEKYTSAELHPDDVKKCLIKYLNLRLQPVRDHIQNHPEVKKLAQLVNSYTSK